MKLQTMAILISLSLLPPCCMAQQPESSSVQDARQPSGSPIASAQQIPADKMPTGAYGYPYTGFVACGGGAAYSQSDLKPTIGCGFGFGIGPNLVTEFGLMGPSLNQSNFTAYFSEDFVLPIPVPKPAVKLVHGHPILLTGYTRMFETGRNSFDYGVGFERHVSEDQTLQFELRDYWTFASPQQHNVMFRIVWITGVQD